MARRRFANCLNQELRAFNCSIGSLIGGGVCFVLFGLAKGIMWGIGFGSMGFMFGKWFSTSWFTGKLQRQLYWHLPWASLWIDKNTPNSHRRKLM